MLLNFRWNKALGNRNLLSGVWLRYGYKVQSIIFLNLNEKYCSIHELKTVFLRQVSIFESFRVRVKFSIMNMK